MIEVRHPDLPRAALGRIEGAKYAEQAAPTPATAFHALNAATERLSVAAVRAEALADKLVGNVPPNGNNVKETARNGLFGAVRDSAETAMVDAQRIHDALARIEAALP